MNIKDKYCPICGSDTWAVCATCEGHGFTDMETGAPSPPGYAFDSSACYSCDGDGGHCENRDCPSWEEVAASRV